MRLVAIGRESESRTPALRSQSASASVTPIPEIFLWTICFVLVCRPQNMQGFYLETFRSIRGRLDLYSNHIHSNERSGSLVARTVAPRTVR